MVLRGVAFYGLYLGAVSTAVLLPATWGRRRRARRLLPWTLTFVLAAAAAACWWHAHDFAYFLPAGINRRLLRAAEWLTLGAVVCFYTAWLHRLRRRPYGPRSRLLILTMAVAAVYVVFERREAFEGPRGPAPRPSVVEGSPRPRLLFVAADTATLEAILPLAERGRLPFFSRMLKEGAYGRVVAIRPTRPLPLWTTIATGKYPYQHRISGSREFPAPFLRSVDLSLLPRRIAFQRWGLVGQGREPLAADRQALPLWEILTRLGEAAAVVAWPLTTPPPPVAYALSDRFFVDEEASGVAPAELAGRARLFRPTTTTLEPELERNLGPNPPEPVLTALFTDAWREELAAYLLDVEPPPEAMFVFLPGLRTVAALTYGGYAAVEFDGVQDDASVAAARLLSAYYMHLDAFLSRLWERCPEPRLLAVVSMAGVGAPQGLADLARRLRGRPPTAGRFSGAPDGVFLLMGEGIRPGARFGPAAGVDVVPTLLYSLGFPIARDFDGAVQTEAFDAPFLRRRSLTVIPSYEAIGGGDEPTGAD